MLQVTSDNEGRILAATACLPGTYNDKTTVRFDNFVQSIHRDGVYETVSFTLLDAAGNPFTFWGMYLICDGGYHKWRCLQAPLGGDPVLPKEVRYNERILGLRKDVECCFGRLKGQFRILKTPLLFTDPTRGKLDNVFFTCCILHNMIMVWKETGLLNPDAEAGIDYGAEAADENGAEYVGGFHLDASDGSDNDDVGDGVGSSTRHVIPVPGTGRGRVVRIVLDAETDASAMGAHWNFSNGVVPAAAIETQHGYRDLQVALVEHFWKVDSRGLVPWARDAALRAPRY